MPRGTAARELSEPLDVGGHRFAVELVPAGGGAGTAVSVRAVETGVDTGGETAAETAPGSVLLRNALIERADLVRDDAPDAGERHLLQYLPAGAPEEHSRAALAEARRRLSGLLAPASAVASGTREVPDGGVNLLWWDERANFGDAVGPWLVRSLTGLTPVNGWRRNLSVPPLVTVGSTAGWLEQDGTRIWGAGLMTPLSSGTVTRLAGLRGIRIDAVRGELTANELRSRLSWTVPEVYGDPALLLPRFLPVPDGQPSQGRVAVLPHVDHQGLFGPRGTFDEPSASANSSTSGKASASGEAGETSEGRGSRGVHVIDARQGVEQVVREVAAARVCISSSLHGIIVAQAYGVPWVWVRIEDALIAGDTFKFRDFFTTLDASAVAAVSMTAAAARDMHPAVLARKAALPRLRISLDALLDAFPLPRRP